MSCRSISPKTAESGRGIIQFQSQSSSINIRPVPLVDCFGLTLPEVSSTVSTLPSAFWSVVFKYPR
jgi:hypothetical protein